MQEIVRAYVLVRGEVQGVGFRAFTCRQATSKHLHGWVRNRTDGGVDLEVEGPEPSVKAFIETIEQGPPRSQVNQITVDWKEPTRQTDGFQILHAY